MPGPQILNKPLITCVQDIGLFHWFTWTVAWCTVAWCGTISSASAGSRKWLISHQTPFPCGRVGSGNKTTYNWHLTFELTSNEIFVIDIYEFRCTEWLYGLVTCTGMTLKSEHGWLFIVQMLVCILPSAYCLLPPWTSHCEGDGHDHWRTGLWRPLPPAGGWGWDRLPTSIIPSVDHLPGPNASAAEQLAGELLYLLALLHVSGVSIIV